MKIQHEGIESIQKVVRHNSAEQKVELKENYYFSSSGTQTQYFDSEEEICNHLDEITYCDGR